MPDSASIKFPGNALGKLEAIVVNKRLEVAEFLKTTSRETLRNEVAALAPFALPFPFERALKNSPSPALITEIKPSSPSAGVLQAHVDLDALLSAYNQFASAISVLTDEKYFGGSFERLAEVSRQSPHPTLCKDFVIDPAWVYRARLSGASAVLLIVKILDDATLVNLHSLVRECGMTPVVEVQNEDELARALAIDATVLLINNRNLGTFEIDLNTTHHLVETLRQSVSPDILRTMIVISASGIEKRADIDHLLPSARCFLIGSSLMRQPMDQLPVILSNLTAPVA